MDPTMSICSFCGNQVPADSVFCPHCGKQLKEIPLSTTVFTQIWIYGMSVLLPPLGLWPGIRYFKHSDPKAKQIGMIAIVLTVVASVATIWLSYALTESYLNTLNQTLNGIY